MSGKALWYLTRGSGAVSLVLLTLALVLGILTSARWVRERWPRFVVEGLHRNLALLAPVFVGIHIASAVVDYLSGNSVPPPGRTLVFDSWGKRATSRVTVPDATSTRRKTTSRRRSPFPPPAATSFQATTDFPSGNTATGSPMSPRRNE